MIGKTLIMLFVFNAINAIDYEETTNSGILFVRLSEAKVSYDTYTMLYYMDLKEFWEIEKKSRKFH